MRDQRLATVLGLCAVIVGLPLLVALPRARTNMQAVATAKYLASNASLPQNVVAGLLGEPPVSSRELTTLALVWVGLYRAGGEDRARSWLDQALAHGGWEERQAVGIRLEQQGERWAEEGQTERARVIFELVRSLTLPFPEPYVRMGEFSYSTLLPVGMAYDRAFELATAAVADTPRDRAFKSMAHTRLCEYALRSKADYQGAEEHCQTAIRLDTYGVFTTWHTPLAHILLGEALAGQGRYVEAGVALLRAVRAAPSAGYAANAWYDLGSLVWEPQGLWGKALDAYRQIDPAGGSWFESAQKKVVVICGQHPELRCTGS